MRLIVKGTPLLFCCFAVLNIHSLSAQQKTTEKPTPKLTKAGDQPLGAFIHHDNIPLLASPGGKPLNTPAEYLRSFLVVKESNGYILLASTPDGSVETNTYDTLYGWIRREQCLTFPWDRGWKAEADSETGVYLKGMVVNSARATDINQWGDVPVYTSSTGMKESEYITANPLKFFDIFYIFDRQDGRAFIGRAPYVDAFEREYPQPASDLVKREMLGWVPIEDNGAERLVFWNTREAIEFNNEDGVRREPIVVFKDKEFLEEYLSVDARPIEEYEQEGKLLAREVLDGKEWKKWPATTSRYPVLSRSESPVRGCNIYEIGVIGDVLDADTRERLVSREVFQVQQRQADKLIVDANTFEIVFVVDATQGMQNYFKTVRESINLIVETLGSLAGRGTLNASSRANIPAPKFSVNFYRGALGQGAFAPGLEPQFKAIERVNRTNAMLGGGRQKVFEGILEATARSFTDHSSYESGAVVKQGSKNTTKMLIVIGDGANDPDDKRFSPRKVASEIIKMTSGGGDGASAPFLLLLSVGNNDACQAQMEEIAAAFRAEAVKAIFSDEDLKKLSAVNRSAMERRLANVAPISDQDRILSAIKLATEYKREEALLKADTLRNPNEIPVSDTKPSYEIMWARQAMQMLENEGLTEYIRAGGGLQAFDRGWTFDRHPDERRVDGKIIDSLRHVTFFRREELQSFTYFLESATRFNQANAGELWKRALSGILGEEPDELALTENLDQLAGKYLGVQCHTGFLLYSYKELGGLSQEHQANLLHQVAVKINHMRDAEAKRIAKYSDSGTIRKWVRVPNSLKRWEFWYPESRGLNAHGWIPREFLP
ncbi:vWA domain-containing protein [Rhodopirellula sallentina]|nr:vWA domain-containing protein [Rhodopirellula sallentina]